MKPTDANIIIGAISNTEHQNCGKQTRYLLPLLTQQEYEQQVMAPQTVQNNLESTAKVMHRKVFPHFDFSSVTERMDE
jgi:hypothetical protein